jgi:hypothetical protein
MSAVEEPRQLILRNGQPNHFILCRGCGVESYYRPTCHQCNRDNLRDLIEEIKGAPLPAPSGVTLAEYLKPKFKGSMQPTETLPDQLSFIPPPNLKALLSGGPSPAGWSITSGMLECPYRGQLMSHNVQRRVDWAMGDELDRLGYGSLMHVLLAVRWVYGMDWALSLLGSYGVDLHPADKLKAEAALKTYDYTWPRENEPWIVLGIESTVFTEVSPGVIVSVRYDAIVKPWETDPVTGAYTGKVADHVISLERKTTATGGESTMTSYLGQFYTQTAVWNFNQALVAKYGPMVGVIGDLVTKHTVPRAERIGPKYISKAQQDLAKRYMSYKTSIRYPIDENGRLPQMLHACIGRYGPCPYFGLCHEEAINNYQQITEEEAYE